MFNIQAPGWSFQILQNQPRLDGSRARLDTESSQIIQSPHFQNCHDSSPSVFQCGKKGCVAAEYEEKSTRDPAQMHSPNQAKFGLGLGPASPSQANLQKVGVQPVSITPNLAWAWIQPVPTSLRQLLEVTCSASFSFSITFTKRLPLAGLRVAQLRLSAKLEHLLQGLVSISWLLNVTGGVSTTPCYMTL